MHNEIEVPFILNAIKEVGDSFLTDFKKAPIPEDRETFAVLFNDLEQRCLSSLKTSLHTRFPYTPWIEGEFDFEAQKCSQRTTEYWLCDSMDGAVQYLQHLPGWTINLVLVRDGNPYFAAIYDPLQQEMYWAKHGAGAYLNDARMNVAAKTDPWLMLVAFDHPPFSKKVAGLNQRIGESVQNLLDHFGAVRNYGPHGLQIASVGAGRVDVFCQEGLDTYNWLAGILIAKEAGAQISTVDGRAWTWGESSLFVAAHGVQNAYLGRKLVSIPPPPPQP
jgi:myo-inositol-1(or 4)-monophosphatase